MVNLDQILFESKNYPYQTVSEFINGEHFSIEIRRLILNDRHSKEHIINQYNIPIFTSKTFNQDDIVEMQNIAKRMLGSQVERVVITEISGCNGLRYTIRLV